MLVVTEHDNGYVAIGPVIVRVKPRGDRVRLAIDAPENVKITRSDHVRADLKRFGMHEHNNDVWFYNGQAFTTAEAWEIYNNALHS